MGIQINVNAKQDYSTLFSSLGSSSGSSGNMLGINLTDYASIKSGSYGKLMKAYYSKSKAGSSDEVSTLAKESNVYGASSDSATVNKSLTTASESLKTATDVLANKQSDSVLNGTDDEAKTKAASNFVESYNKMISASQDSNNKNVISTVESMSNLAKSYEKSLKEIGITIGDDNKLSVDKDTFGKADKDKIANVFQGAGSFGYGVSLKASMVDMYAKSDAEKQSGIYGSNAKYDATTVTASTYSDLF